MGLHDVVGVHRVDVQLGGVCVSGVPDQYQFTAHAHRVADFHLDAAGLEMCIYDVLPVANMDDHVVPGDVIDVAGLRVWFEGGDVRVVGEDRRNSSADFTL